MYPDPLSLSDPEGPPPPPPTLSTQIPISPGPLKSTPPWAAVVSVDSCTLTKMSLDSLGLALQKDCPKQR